MATNSFRTPTWVVKEVSRIGQNSLKFGANVERILSNEDFTTLTLGQWTFGSIATFLQASPSGDRERTGICSIPGAERARVGAIIQIPDPQSLAPVLRFLFANPDFSDRMGQKARWLLENSLNPTDRILRELSLRMPSRITGGADAVGRAGKAVLPAGSWQEARK